MSDDFFEGGSGVPGISWKGMKKGTSITGVIVPVQDEGETKAYRTTKQTDIDTGEVLNYKDGSPRTQAELTLATDLTGHEHTSTSYQDNVSEDDEDNGLRRLFVRGPSLPKQFKEALKAAKAKKPEVGGTVTVTFVKDEPIEGSKFRKNLFEVAYEKPTGESVAKAEAAAALLDDQGGADEGSGEKDEEPPF